MFGRYIYVVVSIIDLDLSIPTAKPHIQGVADGPSRGRTVIASGSAPETSESLDPTAKFAWHPDRLVGDSSFTF